MLMAEGRNRLAGILFRQALVGKGADHEDDGNTQATTQPLLPSALAPVHLRRDTPLRLICYDGSPWEMSRLLWNGTVVPRPSG